MPPPPPAARPPPAPTPPRPPPPPPPPHTRTQTSHLPLSFNTPLYLTGVLRGSTRGREGSKKARGRPVAQWWLSHLVIIAGQAHSTVSSVPSHLIPDTLPKSIKTPLLAPACPPCSLVGGVLSAGVFSFFFSFKGQRWVQGSAVFPGVQINLRLGSNRSSTGLFDESVGQWHALAVTPWSLAFFSCHFPPHLNARFMPASSAWVAHRPKPRVF